jgi:hypothetical protein
LKTRSGIEPGLAAITKSDFSLSSETALNAGTNPPLPKTISMAALIGSRGNPGWIIPHFGKRLIYRQS